MKMHPEPLPLGETAPDFELPATNGQTYRLADFDGNRVLVYVQASNRCPYMLAYLERIKAFAEAYADQGVQFVLVNSNDANEEQPDVFAEMKKFDDTYELNMPYLWDESQSVAQAYRTFRTPEVLVFDRERRLRYRGRIDDNTQDPAMVERHDLRDAIDALLAGDTVPHPETFPVGCTVEWRSGNEPQAVSPPA